MTLEYDINPPLACFWVQERWRSIWHVREVEVAACPNLFSMSMKGRTNYGSYFMYLMGLPYHRSPLMFSTWPQPTHTPKIHRD